MIDMKVDLAPLKDLKRREVAQALKSSAARALNRALKSAQSLGQREIAKSTRMMKRNLRPFVSLKRARSSDLTAVIRVGGRVIPAVNFSPQEVLIETKMGWRLGVSVRYPGQKRHIVPGGFLAKVKRTGYVGIFRRTGRARLPIKQVYAPYNGVELAEKAGAISKMRAHAEARLRIEAAREANFLAKELPNRRAKAFRALVPEF
jgi:hypothetical protein